MKYVGEAEEVWGTICAVLVLRLKYAAEEGEWKLMANKAKRWLKARGIADASPVRLSPCVDLNLI